MLENIVTVGAIALMINIIIMDHNFGKKNVPKWEEYLAIASCMVTIVTLAIGSVMGLVKLFS